MSNDFREGDKIELSIAGKPKQTFNVVREMASPKSSGISDALRMQETTGTFPGLLIVGQAASKETFEKKMPPMSGRSGQLLAELMGIDQDEMLAKHDFVNVIERWPGHHPIKGDKFPMEEAKRMAALLVPKLSNRVVVLLGANVATAFAMPAFKYFEEYILSINIQNGPAVPPPYAIIVVPHPSGLNRWYTDPEKREVACKVLSMLHKNFQRRT